MLFWIIAAGLVAVIAAALVLPALRAGRSAPRGAEAQDAPGVVGAQDAPGVVGAQGAPGTGAAPVRGEPSDLAVYRAQLAEVEREAARGRVEAAEAGRLRLEVQRRILEADRAAQGARPAGAAPRGAGVAGAVIGAAALGGAVALYVDLGAPGYPDRPIALRHAEAEAAFAARPGQAEAERAAAAARPAPSPDPQLADLLAQLRASVKTRPDAEQGYALLAQNEGAIGNYRGAWQAQERLIALKGARATADDHAALVDLMVQAAGGVVTPEAEAAIEAALARDPANPTARFYGGLMLAQNGRPDRTFPIWARLLEDGPPDAPWIAPIRAMIGELAWLAGQPDYAPPGPGPDGPGPDAAQVEAAQEMTPEARGAMIRSMVDGLRERLAREGGPAADWARLVGALGVLGDAQGQAQALAQARAALAGDAAGLAQVEAAARARPGGPGVARQDGAPQDGAGAGQ